MTAHNTGAEYLPAVRHDWMTDALCAQVDGDLWFPEPGSPGLGARKVCAACPVKAQCAEFALTVHARDGIWGGVSAERLRRTS